MTVDGVHRRVLVTVGAWLTGAAAATGGSFLAVSALGQGIAASPSHQLSVAAVNRALAGEATRRPTPSPGGGADSKGPVSAGPATERGVPPPRRLESRPTPRPLAGTVLTSEGGTVVAGCQSAATAYLLSWSPQQGFAADAVQRGPGAAAQVTFSDSRRAVTMTVSCAGGRPSETTTVHSTWGGGGDD